MVNYTLRLDLVMMVRDRDRYKEREREKQRERERERERGREREGEAHLLIACSRRQMKSMQTRHWALLRCAPEPAEPCLVGCGTVASSGNCTHKVYANTKFMLTEKRLRILQIKTGKDGKWRWWNASIPVKSDQGKMCFL